MTSEAGLYHASGRHLRSASYLLSSKIKNYTLLEIQAVHNLLVM